MLEKSRDSVPIINRVSNHDFSIVEISLSIGITVFVTANRKSVFFDRVIPPRDPPTIEFLESHPIEIQSDLMPVQQ